MIRRMFWALIGTADDHVIDLTDNLEEAHEEIARLIGRVANLTAECQALRLIIDNRNAEIVRVNSELASFMDDRLAQ